MFRGKMRNAGKLQRLLLGEGIADLDCSVILDADNIARLGFLYICAILSHEDSGIG